MLNKVITSGLQSIIGFTFIIALASCFQLPVNLTPGIVSIIIQDEFGTASSFRLKSVIINSKQIELEPDWRRFQKQHQVKAMLGSEIVIQAESAEKPGISINEIKVGLNAMHQFHIGAAEGIRGQFDANNNMRSDPFELVLSEDLCKPRIGSVWVELRSMTRAYARKSIAANNCRCTLVPIPMGQYVVTVFDSGSPTAVGVTTIRNVEGKRSANVRREIDTGRLLID